MKTVCLVMIAAACAQSIVTAGETKPGETTPQLTLEIILQAPSATQPNWNALKGKVVVLEFWATWCGPCVAAIPHLNELADKLKDEPIQFIAITAEDEKVVRSFLRKKPIHAWIGFNSNKSMFEDYAVTGISNKEILGPQGKICEL